MGEIVYFNHFVYSGPMRSISATDAKQRLAALLDAAQREPVVIRGQKRDIAVVLSPHEYDRLRALNAAEFQKFCDRIAENAASRGLTAKNARRAGRSALPAKVRPLYLDSRSSGIHSIAGPRR